MRARRPRPMQTNDKDSERTALPEAIASSEGRQAEEAHRRRVVAILKARAEASGQDAWLQLAAASAALEAALSARLARVAAPESRTSRRSFRPPQDDIISSVIGTPKSCQIAPPRNWLACN